ncbi:intradiol ring-cleavage dioxygenase [Roseivirga sp. UBA1976]|jgi:protocatechuate 3,4-dioxygenase beta subunit|uniref:dioxygenase family protein n=1 Tax=Roseivirga sp. UBA1976 TaxID=1947386 RepID=UPI00257EF570|nr:intradiol ring-cleavage dioxygenase [Roseivirga sp. UBA1976]MEC7752521.1 intradiol ring-cleavage dioxygenase [Bacteroidota bacterium]|tara:strand:+ start:3164 stop:3826 length:663 start_codon:yes stop_codon:yes gene_type:complete
MRTRLLIEKNQLTKVVIVHPAMRNLFIGLLLWPLYSQAQILGGPCEGCEALLEYGNKTLTSTDTLPGFKEGAPQMIIQGTVFQKDGHTPAEGVIIYAYHTNSEGIYPTRGNETGWGRRHGYIRGWAITDKNGQYTFYTFRPGSYPGRTAPAHVHLTIKEPGKREYYIDDIMFEDDELLSQSIRKDRKNRGGNGIVNLKEENGFFWARRDIFLGLNIPNYR